jgi:hypothetical protein
MRMWNVNPKVMCDQHLLGEHLEMHMFVGTIRNGVSLDGYIERGLLETHNIGARHLELAQEMSKRGMNHLSPLTLPTTQEERGSVDVEANLLELARRCQRCSYLQLQLEDL